MAKRTLLLINGSQVLMDITKRILERDAYSVRCALGLSGAREQLSDRVPDGILLARELPDGDGLECLRELVTPGGVPVLFLSDKEEDELAALRIGAFDFLKKPYDFEVLKARVRIMLEGSGATSATGNQSTDVAATAAAEEQTDDVAFAAPTSERRSESDDNAGGPQSGGDRLRKLAAATRIYRPVVTAACFVLAAALAWMLLPGLGGGPGASDGITGRWNINLNDAPVPQGAATEQLIQGSATELIPGSAAEPSAAAGSGVVLPEVRDATVTAGSADADISLSNPAGNRCHMQFDIILRETGEILYTSDTFEPGARTGSVTLTRAPEAGEHAAELVIRMSAIEDFAPVGVARMGFTITVSH